MQHVILNRQRIGSLPSTLPDVDGYVAVLDCDTVGQLWNIQHEGKAETFLVTDCAGDWYTRYWMKYNQVLGEVDYETAVRWNTVGQAANIAVCRHHLLSKKLIQAD